jgi:hypothetical protein
MYASWPVDWAGNDATVLCVRHRAIGEIAP